MPPAQLIGTKYNFAHWWMRGPFIPLAAPLFFLGGCLGLVPDSSVTRSIGPTNNGVLLRGVSLPDEGPGYVRARPGESTRFGTPTLVGALTRAAASVHVAFPGSAPLRIGDLAAPTGGRHERHGSHRTGRDVDTIFYVTDVGGRSVRGRGWLGFGRFGVARETVAPEGRAPTNDIFFYDDARNWHFVRTLLMDEDASVQWIFCSRGVKARLLSYAATVETDPEVLFRASWVLHQPSRGHPHHDHFHVRVACTPEEQAQGCFNRAPVWPWIRDRVEKPAQPASADTDDVLVEALMSELPPDDDEPEASP